MRHRLFATAVFGFTLLVGCAAALREDAAGSGLSIRTDRTEYTVTRDAQSLETTIGVTLANGTGGRAYLPTCRGVNPPVLEKRVGDRWVTAFAPVVLQCLGPPEVVEPGETFAYTFHVSAGLPGSSVHPRFEVEEIPGTYRLVWAVYRTWEADGGRPGLGEQFPPEARASHEFTLRG